MEIRRFDEFGRICIPRSIRTQLFGRLDTEGKEMAVTVKKGSIILTPVAEADAVNYPGIDATKISFNEIDDSDRPLQIFFNYDISLYKTVRYLVENLGITNKFQIQSIEICVTVFSANDNKVELIVNYGDARGNQNEQSWYVIDERTSDISGFLNLLKKAPEDFDKYNKYISK